MAETEACITEYLNKNTYLNATIKHRMTDFIVEEINESGELCKFNPDYKEGNLTRTQKNYRDQSENLRGQREGDGEIR